MALHPKIAEVTADLVDFDERAACGAIEFGGEADCLAAVGIGTWSRAGGLGVGEVLRDDAKPLRLRAEAGGCDFQGCCERVHDQPLEVSMSMRWKAFTIAVLSSN